VESEVSFPS